MTASALYHARVTHRRHGTVDHRLDYGVWYLLLDLDELPTLDRRVPGFGVDRAAPVSFHAADHGPRDGSPLRPWIDARLAEAGVDLEGGPVRLLCFPRILGYTFNPISVWFCHGPDGELRAIDHEVSNTFGGFHHYLAPVAAGDGIRPDGAQVVRTRFAKELFVSPFIDMDASYDFRIRVPDERLSVTVQEDTADGRILTAALVGTRSELTGRALAGAFVRTPLVTVKAIGGIHWEAIKLWRKGAPYRRHEPPPEHLVTVVDRRTEDVPA